MAKIVKVTPIQAHELLVTVGGRAIGFLRNLSFEVDVEHTIAMLQAERFPCIMVGEQLRIDPESPMIKLNFHVLDIKTPHKNGRRVFEFVCLPTKDCPVPPDLADLFLSKLV